MLYGIVDIRQVVVRESKTFGSLWGLRTIRPLHTWNATFQILQVTPCHLVLLIGLPWSSMSAVSYTKKYHGKSGNSGRC
jgi:hypothetical protein